MLSLVPPCRRSLLDEGADAFLGIARHHVLGHHLRRIAIGLGKAHFGLAVERLLAELDGVGRFQRDLFRQRDRGAALGPRRNDTIDQPNLPGARSRWMEMMKFSPVAIEENPAMMMPNAVSTT